MPILRAGRGDFQGLPAPHFHFISGNQEGDIRK